ncbi:MAG: nucleotide exchange factor GrpE [Vicinamibacterales bacterium]
MNESKWKTATAEEAEPGSAEAAAAETPEASEEARIEETIEQLLAPAAEIERLEAEKADLTDRLVRLAAEMDNLRKRTERDVADARKYAVTKFAADMLVVGDSLKRALEVTPAERRESDENLKAFAEGVEMTAREMDRLLEKNGITRIAALGERFDPHRHQAMFEVADPNLPPGTVAQVMQEGYQIGDRVLRAALVGVSKGGPASEVAAEADAGEVGPDSAGASE